MRYALFSEIAHGGNAVLTAYEEVYLHGGGGDPMKAALNVYAQANNLDPQSAEVRIAVGDKLIDALIAQTSCLWQEFQNASRESAQYKQYFEEKLDQIGDMKAEQMRAKYPGAYRLSGPPGSGVGPESDGGGDG